MAELLKELHDPVRLLQRKDNKKLVYGVLSLIEIDLDKLTADELTELKQVHDKGESVAAWLVRHSQSIILDEGIKTYKETWKDITSDEQVRIVFDGSMPLPYRRWFGVTLLAILMALNLSELVMAIITFICGDWVYGLVDLVMFAISLALWRNCLHSIRHFWRREGLKDVRI